MFVGIDPGKSGAIAVIDAEGCFVAVVTERAVTLQCLRRSEQCQDRA